MHNPQGALIYLRPDRYGLVLYRHREKNENKALAFAGAADAADYAKRYNLIVIHKED